MSTPNASRSLATSESGGGEPATLDHLVSAAQADMVIARSRVSNLLGVPVAFLIGWVLWGAVAPAWIVGWVIAKVMVSGWRVWITWQYDRSDPPASPKARRWGRQFVVALAAEGAVFGLLGTALMPTHDPALAATMVATLLGIAALSLVILSMSFQASLALTMPTLVPGMLYQFLQPGDLALFTGLGMAIFLGLVIVESRKAAEHTRAMLRLRFQMDELALQRQQALALAERNTAVKSQFLATMSHEMRTPLHGVLGLTRLLQAEATTGDASLRAHRLKTLEHTGEHLLGIINDVLDYSRIEGGHLRLQPHPFDLAALVGSVVELAEISASHKGLELTAHTNLPTPCWVMGESAQLRQVLLNLVGNAVKFTARGQVAIRVHKELGRPTVFEVADTGPGVPPDQREIIFKPFQQGDNSFARRHGGTGLGLAISRELAQVMGGSLVCADDAPTGATFVLTLPLHGTEPPAAIKPASLEDVALAGRVLLVEDNPVNAMVAEAMLLRHGVTVEMAVDGEQAVARFEQAHFDLILMDCQMPGIDGFEATARIRARERAAGRRAVPIVALTANALVGDRERSLAAGMNDHLAKPFRDTELAQLLRQHLPG